MCFHGNQPSKAIKHLIISIFFKYHSPGFIYFSTILAPAISSLDEIYCINEKKDYQFSRERTDIPNINTEPRQIAYE